MSIVSKMLRYAVCYRWMAHLALIVVYIEFAWNYVRFKSNDYYFIRFTHLRKSQNYANKSLNYFAVGDSWIPVWPETMRVLTRIIIISRDLHSSENPQITPISP